MSGQQLLAAVALCVGLGACSSPGTEGSAPSSGSGGSSSGGSSGGSQSSAGGSASAGDDLGDSCVPAAEADPSYAALDVGTVQVELGSESCGSLVCLSNHFQGRATCPIVIAGIG